MDRGKFIVFEGTDGSGKSTQLKLLSRYLAGKGVNVCSTREPTDSPFGGLLKACMSGRLETDERAIAALFAADRLDHITNPVNGIEGKLAAGCTVLCDRYYFSSLAYNGGLAPYDWVFELNRPAMETLPPDLVIFLDLLPEEGMRRVGRRGERERYEQLELQRRIRDNYFATFARLPETRVEVVKSEEDKESTQARIRSIADGLFGF